MLKGLRAVVRAIRAIGRAFGTAIDRVGDAAMAVLGAALRNPTPTVAIATVMLFVLARVPTEIFYGNLGIRPEEVGLNSVQVVLQGSAVILFGSIVTSVLFGLALVAVVSAATGVSAFFMGLSGGQARMRTRQAVRRAVRLSPILIPVTCLTLTMVVLIDWTIEDVERVGSGREADLPFTPWEAMPVDARWSGSDRPFGLPACDYLLYLGEGSNHVFFYNAWLGATYKINSDDVHLRFPITCPRHEDQHRRSR